MQQKVVRNISAVPCPIARAPHQAGAVVASSSAHTMHSARRLSRFGLGSIEKFSGSRFRFPVEKVVQLMKRHLFYLSVGLCIFSVGSAVTSAALSDSQRACLQKAERHEKQGWIYLHIEGAPGER